MNMSMKINSYLDDYSEETISQLLSVSKKILTKAELSLQESPFIESGKIWFSLPDHKDEILINKLVDLGIVRILDENFQSDPIPHIIAYQLNINLDILRNFVKDSDARLRSKTQVETVSWPDYYKWDESGHDFLVADGKRLSFQSKEQDRWKVFNSLASRNGSPVLVATLSEESGIDDEGKVRIVISQINKRIKANGLGNYLRIESVGKGKSGVRGTYRITVPA
jgi:hypothetical protein